MLDLLLVNCVHRTLRLLLNLLLVKSNSSISFFCLNRILVKCNNIISRPFLEIFINLRIDNNNINKKNQQQRVDAEHAISKSDVSLLILSRTNKPIMCFIR